MLFDFCCSKNLPRVLQGEVLPRRQREDILDQQKCSRHPNILSVEEWLATDTHFCLVVEHTNQGSLASMLKEQSTVTEAEAKDLLHQILLALKHCHSLGVTHR